jgi:hypothetical protein
VTTGKAAAEQSKMMDRKEADKGPHEIDRTQKTDRAEGHGRASASHGSGIDRPRRFAARLAKAVRLTPTTSRRPAAATISVQYFGGIEPRRRIAFAVP